MTCTRGQHSADALGSSVTVMANGGDGIAIMSAPRPPLDVFATVCGQLCFAVKWKMHHPPSAKQPVERWIVRIMQQSDPNQGQNTINIPDNEAHGLSASERQVPSPLLKPVFRLNRLVPSIG